MLGIIDYGMGNLASVQNALESVSIASVIIRNPAELKNCDKAILPGVGAFGMAMNNIKNRSFDSAIKDFALSDKKPFLGICLGMQLLFESSEEHGMHEGLGLIEGTVLDMCGRVGEHPIPHMGWNTVTYKAESRLFHTLTDASHDFYFVHRFYCNTSDTDSIAGETEYAITFTSAVEKDNIFGCQFHPEKSQRSGIEILKNFDDL